MREILFRGKVIESTVKEAGEWVYGHLVVRKDHDDEPEQCFICEEGHRFIRCLNKMPCTYKVDPETVGQYAGVKDENGKRYFKCAAYGISNSEATDWGANYLACGFMNNLMDGWTPLLEKIKRKNSDGQMEMEDI